jgi:hypothetical protein
MAHLLRKTGLRPEGEAPAVTAAGAEDAVRSPEPAG